MHFDRWWNPAVENQATDRAFRIGQTKNVLVHKFVCRGTVEEKIDRMIEVEAQLAEDLLGGGGEIILTEMKDDQLLKLVDARSGGGDEGKLSDGLFRLRLGNLCVGRRNVGGPRRRWRSSRSRDGHCAGED